MLNLYLGGVPRSIAGRDLQFRQKKGRFPPSPVGYRRASVKKLKENCFVVPVPHSLRDSPKFGGRKRKTGQFRSPPEADRLWRKSGFEPYSAIATKNNKDGKNKFQKTKRRQRWMGSWPRLFV